MTVGTTVVCTADYSETGLPFTTVRANMKGVVEENRFLMDPKVTFENGKTVYIPERFLMRA